MVYEHDSMVIGMEKAHPQRIPRPVGLHVRYDIFDYLLRIIIGTIKMPLVVLMVHFAVGYIVRVGGVYYPRHTFIITKNHRT